MAGTSLFFWRYTIDVPLEIAQRAIVSGKNLCSLMKVNYSVLLTQMSAGASMVFEPAGKTYAQEVCIYPMYLLLHRWTALMCPMRLTFCENLNSRRTKPVEKTA